MGLFMPPEPQKCGGERQGKGRSPPDHCWKGTNSPKAVPGLHHFCFEPSTPTRECAAGGALERGGPQGKAKGFSGNPHILSLKFPSATVPQPEPRGSPRGPWRGKGGSGRLFRGREGPDHCALLPQPPHTPCLFPRHTPCPLNPFGELTVCVRCSTH